MSQIPKFLLGGINITNNFLGTNLAKTAAYGFVETSAKVMTVGAVIIFATRPAPANIYDDNTIVEGKITVEPRRLHLEH